MFEDLHDYMKSLEYIKLLKPQIIYPGHGPIVKNPLQHIDMYIANRNKREQQILKTLSDYTPKSSLEIVEQVYIVSIGLLLCFLNLLFCKCASYLLK